MVSKRGKAWLIPITATIAVVALIGLSAYLENRHESETLSGVPPSQNYLKALEARNDLSKSINLGAVALFLLAVAPLLRRKDPDITLDFSNKPLVSTLVCVVVGTACSVFYHMQFLTGIIENQKLGQSHPKIHPAQETVPDLFSEAVSFRFDLQRGFLAYAILLYILCLLWAKPWVRRATAESIARSETHPLI
jgi:hypothetical protein